MWPALSGSAIAKRMGYGRQTVYRVLREVYGTRLASVRVALGSWEVHLNSETSKQGVAVRRKNQAWRKFEAAANDDMVSLDFDY
jgi:transposase